MQSLDSYNRENSLIKGSIIFSERDKTIDQAGKDVESSRNTWKLDIVSGDSHIEVEIFSPDEFQHSKAHEVNTTFLSAENVKTFLQVKEEESTSEYVLLKFESPLKKENKVYVKIKDLEKNLLLSEEKIRQFAQEGKLEEAVAKKLSYLPKAIEYSQKTQEAYFKVRPGQMGEAILTAEVENGEEEPSGRKSPIAVSTGLTPDMLFKISKAAAKGLNVYVGPSGEYAIRVKEDKLKIYAINERNVEGHLLSMGGLTRVYEITALHNMSTAALKVPRYEIEQAERISEHQLDILRILNEDPHPAFEKMPKLVVFMNSESGNQEKGYLVSKYQGDIFLSGEDKEYIMSMPDEQRYEGLQNLASGLLHMRKHQVIHGDIKAGNICVTKDGRMIFTDWGGATHVRTERTQEEKLNPELIELIPLGTFTPESTPLNEMIAIDGSVNVCNLMISLEKAAKTQNSVTLDLESIDQAIKTLKDEIEVSKDPPSPFSAANSDMISLLEEIKANNGVYDKSIEYNKEQAEKFEEWSLLRTKHYLQQREQLEVFNLGCVFCELASNGFSPLFLPVEEVEEGATFETPYFNEATYTPYLWEQAARFPVANANYTFEMLSSLIEENLWSKDIANVIARMVDIDPLARPSIAECAKIWSEMKFSRA